MDCWLGEFSKLAVAVGERELSGGLESISFEENPEMSSKKVVRRTEEGLLISVPAP